MLIALKRRMKVAKTGHSLLKMKRDGLMIEFFEVLNKAKTVRKELVEALVKAEQRLQMAMAIEGTVAINSGDGIVTDDEPGRTEFAEHGSAGGN